MVSASTVTVVSHSVLQHYHGMLKPRKWGTNSQPYLMRLDVTTIRVVLVILYNKTEVGIGTAKLFTVANSTKLSQ